MSNEKQTQKGENIERKTDTDLMHDLVFKKYEDDYFKQTPFNDWTEEERKEAVTARQSLFTLYALNKEKSLYIAKEILENIERDWLDDE